jgi:hypothetical protein
VHTTYYGAHFFSRAFLNDEKKKSEGAVWNKCWLKHDADSTFTDSSSLIVMGAVTRAVPIELKLEEAAMYWGATTTHHPPS